MVAHLNYTDTDTSDPELKD